MRMFITNLKREVKTIKKKCPNYAKCVSRHSIGADVHNQPETRGKNYKKEVPQLREMRVEALDWWR